MKMAVEIQGRDILAVLFMLCYFVALLTGCQIPPNLNDLLGVILGFYFAVGARMLIRNTHDGSA